MSYSHVFSESFREGYQISIFSESELNFILQKDLIEVSGQKFFPKFVGEFITPENKYFSVPKNIDPTEENVELFKKCLILYKDLKKDGKTILTNNVFSVSSDGGLKSERYYYNELKEFFLDYITYNFIYPEKHQKFFSRRPISGAKIDVFSTIKMRKQRGPGIVYKVKDIENTEDWNLDDIYWTTLSELSTKYSTQDDRNQIQEVSEFLTEIGFDFKIIDISNREKILSDIHRCDVGIIHQPIKNTLVSYFENKSITTNFKLNIFYTVKFQYVWEELCRDAFFHNEKFKEENKYRLKIKSIGKKSVRSSEIQNFIEGLPSDSEPRINGNMIFYFKYDEIRPDIFSKINDRGKILSFIGDAKYYKDTSNKNARDKYSKEFNEYNKAFDNLYPMCIFLCSDHTTCDPLKDDKTPLELLIFEVSCEDVIHTAINNKQSQKDFRLLKTIHNLIKKYTDRKGPEFSGGF